MSDWKDDFDKQFSIDDYVYRHNYDLDLPLMENIKQFIESLLSKQLEKIDKEWEETLEIEQAEEAHRTEEGYCCACGYDMAVMAGKIKKQRASLIKEFKGVIGEDQIITENDRYKLPEFCEVADIQNQFRAEQRTKLEAIKRNL